MRPISCARAREALSARADGEPDELPAGALDDHLRGCASCTSWEQDATSLTRRLRLHPVAAPADLVAGVTAAATAAPRAGAWPVERVLLLALGVLQLLLSLPPLLLAPEVAADLHVAHEVGVTDIALAVGVLAAAWQPWRAAGMLPVVVVLALGLGATSVLDIAAGRVDAYGEAPHLLAVTDALLLFLLRRRTPAGGSGDGAGAQPAAGLRAVDPERRTG